MSSITVPALVETDWLEQHLLEPDLRVLDCTVFLRIDPETGTRAAETGRADWEQAHIPGAAFADLLSDLSETDNPRFPMEMPTAEKFAASMSALGVSNDSAVVLYDAAGNMWAARVWWMLRAFGFTNAGVLNGGWKKWEAEGRPTASEASDIIPGNFTPNPQPELIAQKEDVLASISEGSTCILNALGAEDFRGGRIPSSVNVPAMGAIVDPETATYRSADELQAHFGEAGATDHEKVITYCGGGIAASSAAFALHLIGVNNVAVYDGSMSEWAKDPEMPMEQG
ncbi:MAG: sulfurtransferase [Sphaerobacteraceae bacterium]|nr:MAG: sulfurtransferase [Sphaerobacteraceae bacterium]